MGNIMKWTTDKPTVEGLYWIEYIKDPELNYVRTIPAYVYLTQAGLVVVSVEWNLPYKFEEFINFAGARISDQPIPEPEEA